MIAPLYFDDSLPAFAALVQEERGDNTIKDNLFLRDVSGRLTFVVLDEANFTTEARINLAAKAALKLGQYVDGNGFAVATPDELFDDRLKNRHQARLIKLESPLYSGEVLLIDRRMVGADWLRDVAATAAPPPRFVFASIKGGVGRSTALCVLAAHLASQGRRVLTIDMDIEAPGLGNMLLPDKTLPPFGLLDYLVEHNLHTLDDEFYVDMVGSSWLGGGRGRVDVIPAIGQRSLDTPANVLAKIARAYLDGDQTQAGGESSSFMDHVRTLIDRFADPLRYDVILIDARAGLHETTATAIVGLGAQVLFFGLDQPQTFAGYALLFSHLGTLPIDKQDDWRNRLQFIQAKSPSNPDRRNNFDCQINDLFNTYLYPTTPRLTDNSEIAALGDTFDVVWDDSVQTDEIIGMDESDIPVIAILDDSRYASFDPLNDRDALSASAYSNTFGMFLEAMTNEQKR